MSSYRLGIDIGGTFTDATLIDDDTGEITIAKVRSTPEEDLSVGFMNAVQRVLQDARVSPDQVGIVVHATTAATNAIIEGKVGRTAFLTTQGFRDILEIARQTRPELYNPLFEKAEPLVARNNCYGVPERRSANGDVLVPLDEGAVRAVAGRLREEGIDSVAVCFLHAYLDGSHERRAGDLLEQELPGAHVSLSSEVAPEFREYVRASTTVVNACLQPVVSGYIERVEAALSEAGIRAGLLVMQSSGGVFSAAAASERPVAIVESGPAAGVVAGTHLGSVLDCGDVMTFDMGGTTAKAALIHDSRPLVTREYEVGAAAMAGVGGARGTGYPISTPVVDLVEIGAGGGSIAWIDPGGVLRVGPQSAGADPGPVCYGRGGTEPTVTDANLVLGRLSPGYFLGGEMKLDAGGAKAAIEERCARHLGLDAVETAHAIVEIANAAMVNALRLVSIERGYDPRDFALVGFGGAGPLHANRLAAEIEVPRTLIPVSPGTASSRGLVVTDLEREHARNVLRPAREVDPAEIESFFRELEEQGLGELPDGIERAETLRELDLRYLGQSYELTIPADVAPFAADVLESAIDTFHGEHRKAYGYDATSNGVELVALRVTAIGRISRPRMQRAPLEGEAAAAVKEVRPVYFDETDGFVDCAVYDRERLSAGTTVQGPAIVEEIDSTTVIHPNYQFTVDKYGNLHMEVCDDDR